MKTQTILFSLLGVAIAAISILLFIARVPEFVQVTSADGVLSVEGLAREAQELQVDVLGNYLYEVSPSSVAFTEPLTLTFDVSQAQFDFDIAVYKYNEDVLMWEAVSPAIDSSAMQIIIDQNTLGTYMVKEYVQIESPDFVNTYDSILAMAPAGTVGYEIALGFIAADGSVIRISQKTQLGGCGGVVEHGSRAEMSQLERSARVYVDDVEESLEFLVVARWFVNDNGGCVDEEYLESALEL